MRSTGGTAFLHQSERPLPHLRLPIEEAQRAWVRSCPQPCTSDTAPQPWTGRLAAPVPGHSRTAACSHARDSHERSGSRRERRQQPASQPAGRRRCRGGGGGAGGAAVAAREPSVYWFDQQRQRRAALVVPSTHGQQDSQACRMRHACAGSRCPRPGAYLEAPAWQRWAQCHADMRPTFVALSTERPLVCLPVQNPRKTRQSSTSRSCWATSS
jgi:hypothetical protein